jgi:hypothetical protein
MAWEVVERTAASVVVNRTVNIGAWMSHVPYFPNLAWHAESWKYERIVSKVYNSIIFLNTARMHMINLCLTNIDMLTSWIYAQTNNILWVLEWWTLLGNWAKNGHFLPSAIFLDTIADLQKSKLPPLSLLLPAPSSLRQHGFFCTYWPKIW